MLQVIGRGHTATWHNTRAFAVQHHRTVVGLCRLMWSYRSLTFKTVCQAKLVQPLPQHFILVMSKLPITQGMHFLVYLAQRWNSVGRGPRFFTGKLISVNQTSDSKGAIHCCLWSWVTSVGGQGGWRDYWKLFSTLSLQTHHNPICTDASHSFWQTAWCLVFYSQFVDSN